MLLKKKRLICVVCFTLVTYTIISIIIIMNINKTSFFSFSELSSLIYFFDSSSVWFIYLLFTSQARTLSLFLLYTCQRRVRINVVKIYCYFKRACFSRTAKNFTNILKSFNLSSHDINIMLQIRSHFIKKHIFVNALFTRHNL